MMFCQINNPMINLHAMSKPIILYFMYGQVSAPSLLFWYWTLDWELEESVSSCFICSGRYVWPLPVQTDFPPTWPWVGPITTAYLICSGFDTMTVQRSAVEAFS